MFVFYIIMEYEKNEEITSAKIKRQKNIKIRDVKALRYFILSLTTEMGYTNEYYLKGKSMDYMKECISRYSNGLLATSKKHIVTNNAKSGYLKEIDLKNFPHISKKDFAIIVEADSYDVSDLY